MTPASAPSMSGSTSSGRLGDDRWMHQAAALVTAGTSRMGRGTDNPEVWRAKIALGLSKGGQS